MTTGQQDIIKETVAELLKQQREQAEHTCLLGIDGSQHYKEHEFIRSLMNVSSKLDAIKWSFLGKVLQWAGLILVAAAVTGLLIMAKKHGVELPHYD